MKHLRPTLGTQLRTLLEQLDGAVQDAYVDAGLDYRPRYTPIVRALFTMQTATIRALSQATGVSHSATSQTVSEMVRRDLVRSVPGATDARERDITLTPKALSLRPRLERQWAATAVAVRSLDRELPMPISALLAAAEVALQRRSFADRIARAIARRATEEVE